MPTRPSTDEQLTIRPWPWRPHQRDHPAGQVVVAEEVGLEDFAQGAARQVLDRAGAGEGAVVEQRIQRAAGARHAPRRRRRRCCPHPRSRGESFPAPRPAAGRSPPLAGRSRRPASRGPASVRAASRPMPEEHPVIRIERWVIRGSRGHAPSGGLGAQVAHRDIAFHPVTLDHDPRPFVVDGLNQQRCLARASLPSTSASVEGAARTFTEFAIDVPDRPRAAVGDFGGRPAALDGRFAGTASLPTEDSEKTGSSTSVTKVADRFDVGFGFGGSASRRPGRPARRVPACARRARPVQRRPARHRFRRDRCRLDLGGSAPPTITGSRLSGRGLGQTRAHLPAVLARNHQGGEHAGTQESTSGAASGIRTSISARLSTGAGSGVAVKNAQL